MSLTERVAGFVWEKVKTAADGAAKEGGKTLFTEAIKRISPTSQERVAKSLLANFTQLLSEQFEDYQIFAAEESRFEEDARAFLTNPTVQGLLVEPLDPAIATLSHQRLAELWRDLNLTPVPTGFAWDIVARRYLTKVRATIQKDPDLRAIADHQAIAQIRSDLDRMAGLDPGFRLEEYRTRIRARYGYLRFDSFHVTGSDLERRVQLS